MTQVVYISTCVIEHRCLLTTLSRTSASQTNSFTQEIGLEEDDRFSLCKSERVTIEHKYSYCTEVISLKRETEYWLKQFIDPHLKLGCVEYLLLRHSSSTRAKGCF